MNNKDKEKTYGIEEIYEMFDRKFSHKEIINYIETEKLEGQKVNDKWQVNQKAINNFMNLLAEERAIMIGPFTLDISNIRIEGRILDIGGGGEGVIAQIGKEQVIAIDKKKIELEGAPDSGDLKIIMDAKDLKFIDNTFDTVTAFFTMMYIPFSDHNIIFQEIYRVLKKDGEFLLWDVNIPERTKDSKDIYGIYLHVKTPEKIIETGYGGYWVRKKDIEYYKEIAKNSGFKILEQKVEDQIFFLRFQKA
jgi:ubiquinone/menaquinone biosynthesis C-methylase UbiE